jgi:hypothetical protein
MLAPAEERCRAGVDRRGHFQSVGDISTAQIFGLLQKDVDADDLHVPLMAVPQDHENEASYSSSDKDLWNEEEPDAATVDSWASLGFSANLCALPAPYSIFLVRCCTACRGARLPRLFCATDCR